MSDGTRLAATVYLPASRRPVPAILEALPYRKDDLTAGYRPEYERLRDQYGYAVVRLDVRGTGSSEGVAVDEYGPDEIGDLSDVIAWIAERTWCSGSVGMYGTSYSGFNSLHLAAARPPALKAVIGIFSSDDRYTDDVHYMGGLLKLLDLVDYPLYMVAMNALPPVPAVTGVGWRDAWRKRIEATEPWLLRWLEEQHDGEYWRRGSVRPSYDRIGCPTMLVGGWADGYRNNTFRTIEALGDAGVPHRLLLGPWAHAATSSSLPGPRIDLVPEMVRWWDRWLRGDPNGVDSEPPVAVFVRRSSPPLPDLDEVAGEWRSEPGWPPARAVVDERGLGEGIVTHSVVPDTGTAAWISCAGQLPWGQPTDQRYDDAASLTWEWPGDGLEILGHAVLRARVAADRPVATLAVRLCDVFPDGRSTLITRGTLNLTHRASRETPEALPLNDFVDVELELEATSWAFDPGHRLRLAICGTDWPNTVAPPEPVTLSLDLGTTTLVLPRVDGPAPSPPPSLTASESGPSRPADCVWRVERDVLRRETSCLVDHGSTYAEEGVTCTEHYAGRVTVNTETFAQRADATSSYTLAWPEVTVCSEVRMGLRVSVEAFDVDLELDCREGQDLVAQRSWSRRIPRDLG